LIAYLDERLASFIILNPVSTVNAQHLTSSEEITTVWETVVEYKTAPEDMSANPTASVGDIKETATGADLVETSSALQPVKTGAPETVDADADADAEVDPEAEDDEDDENDDAAPSASASKKSPSASAGKPKATSAPADEASESSAADESSAAAENSGAAEAAPTSSQSAAADQSLAAGESADEDKPVASAVSTGDAPSATPSGAAEAEEIVPGFPAPLLPNANGDIEGIAAESSVMSAPVVATALPSLTALATSGRASMSASASGTRPSISLKDMGASAAGSSPTGVVHSAASKVAFAGVSVAAIAFAGLLLL